LPGSIGTDIVLRQIARDDHRWEGLMKARAFRYERAHALADVFRLQSEAGGGAQFLAGGQSLLASLAFRLSEPSLVIDISRLAELKGISALPTGYVRVGALTTHRELGAHPDVCRHVPLLAEAVPLIAHAAIRNLGTIGGSLAYADAAGRAARLLCGTGGADHRRWAGRGADHTGGQAFSQGCSPRLGLRTS
jgi:carbon-monoxide dehydrogenase medium subunit